MVRTLVVADEVSPFLTVARLREIAPQLVLTAGDLPWDYLDFISSAVDAPVVYVPGNHDPAITGDSRLPGCILNADGRVVEAGGLRIAGLGGCVRYNRGPHQYSQRQYATKAWRLVRQARAQRPVDVLLTHAPPLGLGDGEDGPHQGIEALHRVLARLEPTWHLHGHIHPYGMTMPDRQVGRTTLRNVIPMAVLDITPRCARLAASTA